MKSKFVLTEEESKRILSLHKEKIDKERNVVSEEVSENTNVIEEQNKWWTDPNNNTVKKTVRNGVLTLFKDITLEKATGMGLRNELKLFKGAEFKIVQPGSLISDTTYSFVSSLDGYETYNPKKGKIGYNCKSGKFRILGGGSEDRYFNENFPIESAGFKYMCYLSLKKGKTPTPTPKDDLLQKALKCGWDSVEGYKKSGWKCKKPSGGGENLTGGGSGGGETYTFDYNQILAAINQKCPGGGGGATTPEDQDIVNPFGQGAEEGQPQPQVIKITDKIYSGL
jgi:hypothetical protein